MAATCVGYTTGGSNAAATASTLVSYSANINAGDSPQVNDVMVVFFSFKGAAGAPVVTLPDAGWASLTNTLGGGGASTNGTNGPYYNFTLAGDTQVFWRRLTSSDIAAGAGFSFSWPGTVSGIHTWECVLTRNALQSGAPIELLGTAALGAVASGSFVTVSSTVANELILRHVGGTSSLGSVAVVPVTYTGATALTPAGTQKGLSFGSTAYEAGPGSAGAVTDATFTLPNAMPSNGGRTITVGVLGALTPTVPVLQAGGDPTVSGTRQIGQYVTATTGNWSTGAGTPTGYGYQWQWSNAGTWTNMVGQTGQQYQWTAGDAGRTIRVLVTASNAAGSSTPAPSNSTSLPVAPAVTAAPSISAGTYHTGDVVTPAAGTFTPTGADAPTVSYQWFSNSNPTGVATASYTLQVSDEGANSPGVFRRDTASNGGGSVTADTNAITPVSSAPLSDLSFTVLLSGGTGNTSGAASIGGATGAQYGGTLNGLIGPIPGSVAQAGGTFYRAVYIKNNHASATAANGSLYIETPFGDAQVHLAVGVPVEGVNTSLPALASETAAPSGVTFSTTATSAATGRSFGSLAPGQYRGVWLRIVIDPGAAAIAETDASIAMQATAA